MLKDLSLNEFLSLIFTSEDRLSLNFIHQAKRCKDTIVPFLCSILKNEKYYEPENQSFWATIHAAHILGILGDTRAFEALLYASGASRFHGIHRIGEALPECYLQLGKGIVQGLMKHIEESTPLGVVGSINEIRGLWNIWHLYPEVRKKIEDFFIELLNNPEIDVDTKTVLISDLVKTGREDIKLLLKKFYKEGLVDIETLNPEDLKTNIEHPHQSIWYRYDLEGFYSPIVVKHRRKCRKEEEEKKNHPVEEFILFNFGNFSKNDSCPCGSSKKFKDCHLSWAVEEKVLLEEKEEWDTEFEMLRKGEFVQRNIETALRRILAEKGHADLLTQIKTKVSQASKAPREGEKDKRVGFYFMPFLSKLTFLNDTELQEFLGNLTMYYQLLSAKAATQAKRKKSIN